MNISTKGNLVKISGIYTNQFSSDLTRRYNSTKVLHLFDEVWTIFGIGSIRIHQFFLPELLYLISVLPKRGMYTKLSELILNNTWMSSINRNYSNRINSSRISSDLKFSLKPYQKQFIDLYDDKKQKYLLKGYILAFEQGLGKTFTSLALMHGLGKDAIIIIAPKSTIRSVWKNEIETVFKDKQDIWVIGNPIKKSRFYIVNYESIEKLSQCLPYLMTSKNIGIIVDECHNFKNTSAQRVIRLQSIAKTLRCNDILLMSGTPIKALGSEMIPALDLIDPFFDDDARVNFGKTFGINVEVALDILKNRLGLMMYRKTKEEVLDLPKKNHTEIKIKISNGSKYELENVKTQIFDFINERNDFYKKTKNNYYKDYEQCMSFLETYVKNGQIDSGNYKKYQKIVKNLEKHGYDRTNANQVIEVKWANQFEKEQLRPLLPNELKRKFDASKSVIKYVNLKIMGEVIGGLLNRLRAEMYSNMITASPICDIIRKSIKKTICFTTYTDVVKMAYDHITKKCKYHPVMVFGETTGSLMSILGDFKSKPSVNPLIATIQTLSTGVTLVEANTIIFLNQPWRYVDRVQAEDRVHRIGQDTNVDIYTFVLDTGANQNLSTRLEDIVAWSKDMFEQIVG